MSYFEGTNQDNRSSEIKKSDSYPFSSSSNNNSPPSKSWVLISEQGTPPQGNLLTNQTSDIVQHYFANTEQSATLEFPPRGARYSASLSSPLNSSLSKSVATNGKPLASVSVISDFFTESPAETPKQSSLSNSESNFSEISAPSMSSPVTISGVSEKRPTTARVPSSESLESASGRSSSSPNFLSTQTLVSRGIGKGFATLPPTEPTLLPGETIFQRINSVWEWSTVFMSWQPGTLFLTNFQVVFIPASISSYDDVPTFQGSVIPILAIHHVEKSGRQSDTREHSYIIRLHCKDLRIVRFSFRPQHKTRRKVVEYLTEKVSKTSHLNSFFCFEAPSGCTGRDGWTIYNVEREFQRQGALPLRSTSATSSTSTPTPPVGGAASFAASTASAPSSGGGSGGSIPPRSTAFRMSSVNENWKISGTYPSHVVVPAVATDEVLTSAAGFRSKGRIPSLTWLHPITGAGLFRSSQPMTGMIRTNKDDQKLLEIMSVINTPETSGKLVIIDLRPKPNAYANMAMGMGFESAAQYRTSELRFKGIENIHVMRESFRKLYEVCITTGGADPQWHSKVEATGWSEHVRTILAISAATADVMDREKSHVLAHCSDGWDRTAQVCCLAQLMLDPYYRTLEGFAVLVEKDWLSFGHRFHTRTGHGQANFYEDQRGPIFLQFMDAVYQMTCQFPLDFEFNEYFLRFVLDSLYSCRFGTFLYDTQRERMANKLPTAALSLWSHIDANKMEFINPFYARPAGADAEFSSAHYQRSGMIYPDTSPFAMQFWASYYLRFSWNPHGGALVGGSGAPGAGSGTATTPTSGQPGSGSGGGVISDIPDRATLGPGMIGALVGGMQSGGPPLVTLASFNAGDNLCAKGLEMARRMANIDDSRRMIAIKNEGAVLAFQRETRKQTSTIERLRKENKALKDKIIELTGSAAVDIDGVGGSGQNADETEANWHPLQEPRGRAHAVWEAHEEDAEKARSEYLERELTYLRLRYETDITELQKRLNLLNPHLANEPAGRGVLGVFGIDSDSFELMHQGGGGNTEEKQPEPAESEDKLKKVEELWQSATDRGTGGRSED